MAIIYVDSNKTGGTDAGTSWTNAYLTLQQALNDANALTRDIYVHVGASSPHSETTAATVTLSSSAADTDFAPLHIYGVDANNSDAAVSQPSTRTIEVTGTASDIVITFSGVWHGVNLASDADDFTIATANTSNAFYDCRINCGSASFDDLNTTAADSFIYFENCIVVINGQLEGTSNAIQGGVWFKDCTVTIGQSPNILGGFNTHIARFEGCDFSGNTSGDTIYSQGGRVKAVEFINCDMPVSWTGVTGTWLDLMGSVSFVNCDDSNDYPRTEVYTYAGDTKTDTGVYITSSGWSDETANSTGTPLSQRLTPSSDLNLARPLDSLPIDEYLSTFGSKTFTVELIDDFETALQDDEVWLEIFYHATAGQVKQSIGTSRVILGDTVANLAAGTGVANWTGEPTSSRSVKLAVTVTTGNIGWYSAVVRLAKYEANGADTNPGAALYVAPLLTIT